MTSFPELNNKIEELTSLTKMRNKISQPPISPDFIKGTEMFFNVSIQDAPHVRELSSSSGEMAKKIGGHGGMDFMMDWRLIDCLRNGLPLDETVYDAALWSSIAPLSEWSVANRSNSIDVPDFTCGSYKSNLPVDINLAKGGNTNVRIRTKATKEQLVI